MGHGSRGKHRENTTDAAAYWRIVGVMAMASIPATQQKGFVEWVTANDDVASRYLDCPMKVVEEWLKTQLNS